MKSTLDRASIEDALHQISAILATSSLYSLEHPRVQILFPRIVDTLTNLLRQQQDLTFFLSSKMIFSLMVNLWPELLTQNVSPKNFTLKKLIISFKKRAQN